MRHGAPTSVFIIIYALFEESIIIIVLLAQVTSGGGEVIFVDFALRVRYIFEVTVVTIRFRVTTDMLAY